jgi:hypothetical protein
MTPNLDAKNAEKKRLEEAILAFQKQGGKIKKFKILPFREDALSRNRTKGHLSKRK